MKKFLFYGFIAIALIGHFFGDDTPDSTTVTQTSLQQSTPPKPVPALPNATINRAAPEVVAKPPTPLQPATPKTAIPDPVTMYVDASRLNVRNGPGIDNKQVWTLKRDQAVQTYQRAGDWVFVKGDRFSGWVHGGYLTTNKAKPKSIATTPQKPELSDREIVKILINRSLGEYYGNCPCPYNRTRNGSRCGGRSAYSRPGGASPLCYASDISQQMIANYRARQ